MNIKSTVRKSKKKYRDVCMSAGFDEIINLLIGKVGENFKGNLVVTDSNAPGPFPAPLWYEWFYIGFHSKQFHSILTFDYLVDTYS